jgi:hypothetical protein
MRSRRIGAGIAAVTFVCLIVFTFTFPWPSSRYRSQLTVEFTPRHWGFGRFFLDGACMGGGGTQYGPITVTRITYFPCK